MEKTKEQRQASRERYLAQEAKAYEMLQAENLCDYIDGLKYAYSLCMRYRKNLYSFIHNDPKHFINPFREVLKDATADAKTPFDKCLKAGILTPWKDTYYFDKKKAESLQQYILEHPTN